MAEITLDGIEMHSPGDFYRELFASTHGIVPDYGGRNLDALHDDLRDTSQPLTIIWLNSERARVQLGEWFDRVLEVLSERPPEDAHPITVLLR